MPKSNGPTARLHGSAVDIGGITAVATLVGMDIITKETMALVRSVLRLVEAWDTTVVALSIVVGAEAHAIGALSLFEDRMLKGHSYVICQEPFERIVYS